MSSFCPQLPDRFRSAVAGAAYHRDVFGWMRRKPPPSRYDLRAFHRGLGLPEPLIDDESVARPVMAA
ncbi:hypothetical protein GCM10027610_084670 [Dactylosporangium cerinum]